MLNSVVCGDAADILKSLPDNSVDLVFTDPPYPKKYEYTYDILANECPRIMKCGASLITIAPHYNLETVILKFVGKLKYRWLLNMSQLDGPHARMAMGIEICFKPMLWYVKGSYPQGRGFLSDTICIKPETGVAKKLHKWEQDETWAEYYIHKLTPRGGLVVDPFCGSGTSLVVSKKLGFNYFGIDIDEQSCKTSINRLKGVSDNVKRENN